MTIKDSKHTPEKHNVTVFVCLLTRQHLVQVDGQQQVKDAVEDEHDQRDVERMWAVGQRREHSAISLSLQVNHLHTPLAFTDHFLLDSFHYGCSYPGFWKLTIH